MKKEHFYAAKLHFEQLSQMENRIAQIKGADASFLVQASDLTPKDYKVLREAYVDLLQGHAAAIKKAIDDI